MDPTRDEWNELHKAAIRYHDTAPWKWMEDADVFGVQDPESGQTAYCCVLGMAEELYGLSAYLGSEGLRNMWEMRKGADDPTDQAAMETLALQKCLALHFGRRDELEKADRDVIKDVGLKFRGPLAWPQFRSYLPGYWPWFFTGAEARFMAHILHEAVIVAGRFDDDPYYLPEAEPNGPYLVRVPTVKDGSIEWGDEMRRPEPAPERALAPAPVDEAGAEAVRQRLRHDRGTIEVDVIWSPVPVQEGTDRPYVPRIVIVAGGTQLLAMHLCSPGEFPSEAQNQLLGALERRGAIPARIQVKRQDARDLILPLAEQLGISLMTVRRLKLVDEASEELTEALQTGELPG